MEISEKELEKSLFEAGNNLVSSLSSSSVELLNSLILLEELLGGVEQSPSDSMKEALAPITKNLIAEELLRHSNADVKVAVASCISEITRITAPDAPYEDDQMKEVFQLIVSSFEKLDDESSCSYSRRTSILETVAKVRSCVVMLDLECNDLIDEMFRHFFRTIRDGHHDGVFSNMETIMSLVVEESEEISVDFLLPILNVLKKENKEVLPIASQLGEKVIVNCAAKLKPYLLPAVRSTGASLDDYSKVLSDLCQAGDEAVESADAANDNVIAMETLEDGPPSAEVCPNSMESPKTDLSNGILQKDNNISAAVDNSKEADREYVDTQDAKVEPSETIAEGGSSEEVPEAKSKPEKTNSTSAVNGDPKEADLNMQVQKVEPSVDGVVSEEPPNSKTVPEKSNNTSAVDHNSKAEDLGVQDEKAEPSEMIVDGECSAELPESKTKPEKPDNTSTANDNSKEPDLDTHDEKAEPSEMIVDSEGSEEPPKSKTKPEKSDNTSTADVNSKEPDLDPQDVKAKPSETIADSVVFEELPKPETEPEKSNCTAAANDNSKEADLDMQEEKAEPSKTIADSVISEKPSESITKPEKVDNNSAANDISKETDVFMQDEKADQSETVADSASSEEPPKSMTKPEKLNDTSLDSDNSKEADVDMEAEKTEASETVADSAISEEQPKLETKDEKCDDTSAAIDSSKKADIDMEDEKAEASEMIADSSDEQPKTETRAEKSNDISAAKEADLDKEDKKAEPSETIADSSEEQPKSNTKPKKSYKRKDREPNSMKGSGEPLKPILSDNITKVDDTQERRNNTVNADNTQSKDPVVVTTEETDNVKSSDALIPPTISDNEHVDISSPSPSEGLADETRSKKAVRGKKGTFQKGASRVATKESDTEFEKGDNGSESERNKRGIEKASSPSDQEESVPDVLADKSRSKKPGQGKKGTIPKGASRAITKKNSDTEFEKDDTASESERNKHSIEKASSVDETRSKKAGRGKDTIKKGASRVASKKDSDTEFEREGTGSESERNKQGIEKTSSTSDQEESVPDASDDMKKDDDNSNSAPGLTQETEIGSSQRVNKKKQGQAKATATKSRKRTPAKNDRKTVDLPKSTPKAVEDESDWEKTLKLSSKRKRPSEEKKTVGVPKLTPKAALDESDGEEILKPSSKKKRSSLVKAPKPKVYGDELVGARVQIWWPDDEQFYPGVVNSFYPSEKKHKIFYDDGETETLNLKKETWELINLSEGSSSDDDNPDEVADERQIGKKHKRSADPEAKHGKTAVSAKKYGGSSSKSKSTPKSGFKQDSCKIAGKSKEEVSTKVGKSDNKSGKSTEVSKSAKKAKVDEFDTPKISSKSKAETSKSSSKSKGKTPKSASKPTSSAGGKVKIAISKNIETEDESSEPEPEPKKAPEKSSKGKPQTTPKSQKSSNKRKR